MKRLARILAVICVLIWLVPQARAGGCNRRIIAVHQNVVAVETVVAAAAVFTPIAVAVPAYSVGYDAEGQAVGQLAAEIKGLKDELHALREFIAAGAAGAQPAAKAAEPVIPKGLAIMAAKCAICHDATLSQAKAKGITLFRAGKFLDEGTNASKVIEQVDSRKMPKGGTLTDEERYQLLYYLTIQPVASK